MSAVGELRTPSPPDLSPDLARQAITLVGDLSVDLDQLIRAISPGDTMLFEGNQLHYLYSGADALRCVRLALGAAGQREVRRILDFGCGYGRVARWLRLAFPAAELTVTDVGPGWSYCAQTFSARGAASSTDFTALALPPDQDLIWAGSVFTHLRERDSLDLLDAFLTCLSPGGVAVFSSHGRFVAERMCHKRLNYGVPGAASMIGYAATGYGYEPYAETPTYGVSLTDPAWWARQIARRPGYRLTLYCEQMWDCHHDIVAVSRIPRHPML